MSVAPQKRTFPITHPVYTDDGRRLHTFRQSSLREIDICMERTRRTMSGEVERHDTDATAQGTAFHLGVELSCQSYLDGQDYLALADMIDLACDEFTELSQVEGFLWVKTKSLTTVHRRIARMLTTWEYEVKPTLEPEYAELVWGPLTFHEDDKRVIQMTGCIDYGDVHRGPGDWKTASRPWEAWEHERWDIQPSIYTWALNEMGYHADDGGGIWPFTFHVFNIDGTYKRIPVKRHRGDWEWVKTRAVAVAELIEAQLPRWPLNDNHALCSPTWCPAWDTCKGQFYAPGWPKPSAPQGFSDTGTGV